MDTDSDGDLDTDSDSDTTTTVDIDYCDLHWPCSMSVGQGERSESVYGWNHQGGVTDSDGQGAGITGQVGIGPDGSDPSDGGWTWSDAAYIGDKDGMSPGDLSNDEYEGTFTAPSTAGSYDFAVRFSADGGTSWTVCDAGGESCGGAGSSDGYQPENAGQLTVE